MCMLGLCNPMVVILCSLTPCNLGVKGYFSWLLVCMVAVSLMEVKFLGTLVQNPMYTITDQLHYYSSCGLVIVYAWCWKFELLWRCEDSKILLLLLKMDYQAPPLLLHITWSLVVVFMCFNHIFGRLVQVRICWMVGSFRPCLCFKFNLLRKSLLLGY